MKKLFIPLAIFFTVLAACSTFQSVVKSTFPYTATLFIPQGAQLETANIATSGAASFDEMIGNKEGNSYVRDVTVAVARIDAVDPRNQDLGIFKSANLYLINAKGDKVLLASRADVGQYIGSPLTLDVDRTKVVDPYIRGGNLKLQLEYVLRSKPSQDLQLKATVGFSSLPAKK